MSTVETDTVIRIGTWQPARTPQGRGRGYDIAPVIDGTATIGHLHRYAPDDYRVIPIATGHTGTDAPARCTSALAALIALARQHHNI